MRYLHGVARLVGSRRQLPARQPKDLPALQGEFGQSSGAPDIDSAVA